MPASQRHASAAVLRTEFAGNVLAQSIADALIQISATGEVIHLNPAAEALLGLRETDGQGQCWMDILQPIDRDFVASYIQDALSGVGAAETLSCELTVAKTGRRMRAQLTAGLLPSYARPGGGAVLVIRDVTALDRSQRDFFRAMHLDRLQAFAGGLAARFNNLISPMQASIEALARSGAVDDRHVHNLKRALEGELAMVRELMAISKRLAVDPQLVNLNKIIKDSRPLIEDIVEGAELAIDLEPELGHIEIDPSHGAEILLSLVALARERAGRGGQVRVTTCNQEIQPDQALQFVDRASGKYVMLEVSDNGPVIPGAFEETLFDPLLSSDHSRRGSELAVAYGMTKQSGGYLWYESAGELRNRFVAGWPCQDLMPELVLADRKLDGSETILVLEHDRAARELIQRTLLDHGHHVLEACTAPQAAMIARQWNGALDLMLVNVLTSGGSSLEIARRIQRARPKMQIVYMSSYSSRALFDAGATQIRDRFIQKPFSPDSLMQLIRMSLDAREA